MNSIAQVGEFSFKRSYTGPVKAVIFDWAGTTIDFGSCAPVMVFVEVFKRRNVNITLEEARGPMGVHKRVHVQKLCEMESVRQKWTAVHGKPPTEADVQQLFEEAVPLQNALLPDHCKMIPGVLKTIQKLRTEFGIKIGSTTGYLSDMMAIVKVQAEKQGYEPDSVVCASDVPAGRPEPWMALKNAQNLRVFPFEACVKVDDTVPGIEEGLNAGMWTIGVAKTGNEMGLTEEAVSLLDPADLDHRLQRIRTTFARSGAHYVVDSAADIIPVIEHINQRLARGEKP